MNILFINSDNAMHEEFDEFSIDIHAKSYYSNSTEKSIGLLNEYQIDTVVIQLGKLSDVSILKYINDYYKHIKVLVSAREDFEEVLAIFNQINFEVLPGKLELAELKEHLVH